MERPKIRGLGQLLLETLSHLPTCTTDYVSLSLAAEIATKPLGGLDAAVACSYGTPFLTGRMVPVYCLLHACVS